MQIDIEVLLKESERRCECLRKDLQFELMHQERLEAAKESLGVPAKPNGGHRKAGSLINGSLMSRMIEVFKAEGRPMKAPEVTRLLKAQGYDTNAKSGLSVSVSTTLAHDNDKFFKKIEKGLYDLLER